MAVSPLAEETEKKVLRQVEFYFSDSNLPRDNFLKKSVQASEDGLVSLALICSFTRMRNYLGLGEAKPDDVPEKTVLAVAETLRASSSLKISEDGKKVGRSTELLNPEDIIEQVDTRTIAVSPLPCDIRREDIESFFSQYAKVNSVWLPRRLANKKFFSGCALIEFSTEEDVENVSKQSLVFAGTKLELKPKKDFDIEREKQREEWERRMSDKTGSFSNGSHLDGSYPKGLIISFKLKPRGGIEQKGTDELRDSTENGAVDSNETSSDDVSKMNEEKSTVIIKKGNEENASEEVKKESEEKSNEENAIEDVNNENAKNSTVVVKEENGIKADKDVSKENEEKVIVDVQEESKENVKENEEMVFREDIKGVLQRFGTIKYVDYRMGEESGYVRFEQPEAALKARAAAAIVDEGGLVVKKYIAALEAVTGDAEREYWSKLRGSQERVRDERSHDNRGNRGRGRHNKGGRQSNNTHRRPRDHISTDERPNKTQKVEVKVES